MASEAPVSSNRIEGSNGFWYAREEGEGREFWLVDPERQTRVPAFDHARLGLALSRATGTKMVQRRGSGPATCPVRRAGSKEETRDQGKDGRFL